MFSRILFACTILLITGASCTNAGSREESGRNDFYEATRREDLYRLPILEPMECYSPTGDDWTFDLPFGPAEGLEQVACIMVGMKDSILVVYSGYVSLPGETTQAWFYLDLDKRTTTVCRSSGELRSNAFNASIEMHSIRKAVKQFRETGTLPWEPWIREREAARN